MTLHEYALPLRKRVIAFPFHDAADRYGSGDQGLYAIGWNYDECVGCSAPSLALIYSILR